MAESSETVLIQYKGTATGSITLSVNSSTVGDLRKAIAQQANLDTVQLIAGGRKLQDDSKSLQASGLSLPRTIHVLRAQGSAAATELQQQETRASSLQRLQQAAEALANRRGDRPSHGAPELSLENQDGTVMRFENDEDRRALIIGLSLHEKGRTSLKQGKLQEALDEMLIAEEAFGLCNPVHLPLIDNLGLLSLDIVWCIYQLRQVDKLSQAQQRLAVARAALAKSHGPDKERLRMLHGNFIPQLAVYVRLEALEGIAAFHSNDAPAAAAALQKAMGTWHSLQVSDQDLMNLVSMGFSTRKAARALRFWAGDVSEAAQWLLKDRQDRERRRAEDRERRHRRREQERLGTTDKGHLVDMDVREKLCKLGFDPQLAAEALRLTENSADAALDMLMDPEAEGQLQLSIMERREQRQDRRKRAREASSHNAHGQTSTATCSAAGAAAAGPSHAAAAETGAPPHAAELLQDAIEESDAEGADLDERDIEAENELLKGVSGDPLAAYDVDVGEEGKAIQQYLDKVAKVQGLDA
ncbi:hypothetical protein WJX74_010307 [Apatococcus lobatus]|uniref:UBA domain-containing protein n=1 Tax=Apatococcus lobatus TaxID=904363 RepID=A0AAW1QJ82_9CHLO